ncbi:MAG: hypothetical protein D5R97_09565 [Candidatus Syntrophonatronum acetioxidans]|uniref:Uncharacterized protein n=1 Tax=Candidatus Syntrophonatronum acetioxidans TaxID=1795816 RepID=A0A424YAU3_9FIRM|nr:MAG: hypothetical protein D5R97_09565 [Candidatus Syntrophonatronum acetioxidans]
MFIVEPPPPPSIERTGKEIALDGIVSNKGGKIVLIVSLMVILLGGYLIINYLSDQGNGVIPQEEVMLEAETQADEERMPDVQAEEGPENFEGEEKLRKDYAREMSGKEGLLKVPGNYYLLMSEKEINRQG